MSGHGGRSASASDWGRAVALVLPVFGVAMLLGLAPLLWFVGGLRGMASGKLAVADWGTWGAGALVVVLGVAAWAVVRGSTASDLGRRRRAGMLLGVLALAVVLWLIVTFAR